MKQDHNLDAMKQSFARHFSPSLLARMEETGHAHVEAKTEGNWVIDGEGKRWLDCHCAAGIHNLGRKPDALVTSVQGGYPSYGPG